MNILVSFSGGRTSAWMAKLMKESFLDDDLQFAFANTGKEREETLEFVHQCDKEFDLKVQWVEAKINPAMGVGTTYELTDFYRASRKGEPFEVMLAKYGISNKAFPHCTRELKTRPLNALAKNMFGKEGYVTAIGMRIDEMRRVKYNDPLFMYPMVDWNITVRQVREFWNKMPFDLRLRDFEGNCDLCWKKSLRKKLTLAKQDPEMPKWWSAMETKYSSLQIEGRREMIEPAYFNRGNMPVVDLVKLSTQPFIPVTDIHWKEQPTDWMDAEQSCLCMNAENDGDE